MKRDAFTTTLRWITIFMFLLAGTWALSQTTTSNLSGVVRDSSGAVLPQVKITLRNVARGTVRVATTDVEGRYSLSAVEPGTYELRAERSGFTSEVQTGVVLTVGGASEVNLVLKVGQVNEVINVKDVAPLIEPSKAEVSTVIGEQAIES